LSEEVPGSQSWQLVALPTTPLYLPASHSPHLTEFVVTNSSVSSDSIFLKPALQMQKDAFVQPTGDVEFAGHDKHESLVLEPSAEEYLPALHFTH
jgi:hypothetical protein